jgi:hypothetical protein
VVFAAGINVIFILVSIYYTASLIFLIEHINGGTCRPLRVAAGLRQFLPGGRGSEFPGIGKPLDFFIEC